MQGDEPTDDRPGGPSPVGPGSGTDTVLAALAHRLRARSERQQLLTERLRSGELRPGALADLAELAAAARRGIRDGDHILVMAGAATDRPGGGSAPLGQVLSAAVAASEAASRTVVPPTPSVSLVASAAPVFGQILSELLAHATASTSPGERLELHTRYGPDGGLVIELLSPRPVPTRIPVDELDRMLASGRPDGAVAPQEIGLFLAARLARAIGGRLGVRGAPGNASVSGPSPVAVLRLPPSAFGGSGPVGEGSEVRGAAAVPVPVAAPLPAAGPGADAGPGPVLPSDGRTGDRTDEGRGDLTGDLTDAPADDPADEPTGVVAAAGTGAGGSGGPVDDRTRAPGAVPVPTGPESSIPPWPPLPAADPVPADDAARYPAARNGAVANGAPPETTAPDGPLSDDSRSREVRAQGNPSGGTPPNGAGPYAFPNGAGPRPAPGGPDTRTPFGPGPGPARLPVPPAPGRPAHPGPGGPAMPAPTFTGAAGDGPSDRGAPTNGRRGPTPPAPAPSGPDSSEFPPTQLPPTEFPPTEFPPTEALPVAGTTPPVELFGPFDSEVPVPIDDLDGTPIFAAVASAWFREPSTPPGGAPAGELPPPGTNGHSGGPANWRTGGDAEFEAARIRADRVVEAPVNANGLPIRRPGQQMVPPSRRDTAAPGPRRTADRQPDRVRNRLASYQRGLREGRHRAAEESAATTDDAHGVNGAGLGGHAAG